VSPGGLATLLVFIVLVVTLFGWTGYAYFYPHTWSGQLLIKVILPAHTRQIGKEQYLCTVVSIPVTQGVTMRCRLSWLTTSALVNEPKCGG
jgi:hypothetical protein